jgi:MFS family permease
MNQVRAASTARSVAQLVLRERMRERDSLVQFYNNALIEVHHWVIPCKTRQSPILLDQSPVSCVATNGDKITEFKWGASLVANLPDSIAPQVSSDLSHARAWPVPWTFGLLILPLGMYVGFIWTALPFLLSKSGVSVEHISRMAAILQIPPLLMFLWTPVVDVRLRRRTWLVLAAFGAATCVCFACPLIGPSSINLLAVLLFIAGGVLGLVFASCGGLMATTFSPSEQGKAAAWSMAGNFGGGVTGAAIVLWLAQRVSLPWIGIAMAALILLPALLAFTISEGPPASSYWFRGRFAEIRQEGFALFRSPRRRWGFLLLLSPGCTCSVQPLLPALASHYGVNANGVLWINGVAGGIVLAAGSLFGVLVPGDWDRRLTYVGAGLVNCIGAIVLLAPNRPAVYMAGSLIYLLTAGFCQARAVALILDVVGREISDLSTWFSALTSLSLIPIISMIWLGGRMFHYFGAHGLLWTDAAGNLLIGAVVATAFLTHVSLRLSSPVPSPGNERSDTEH